MSARPNVLWVCTDQQRADTLGCYGNPWVRTPNLDRLAQRGVRFEHAYAQSPVCTPSRASFLTGRYPRTTRCRQNGQSIPGDEVLVTRLLADAGYSAGLSGKLHVSALPPLGRAGQRAPDRGRLRQLPVVAPPRPRLARQRLRLLAALARRRVLHSALPRLGPRAERDAGRAPPDDVVRRAGHRVHPGPRGSCDALAVLR